MNNHKSIYAVLGAALLLTTTACGDNGGTGTDTEPTTTMVATSTAGTTTAGTTTAGTTTENPTTTTNTTVTTTTDASTSTTDVTTATTTGGGGGYNFPTDPPSAYTQMDRHAAVEAGTAGIAAAQGLGFKMGSDITIRTAYNKSNPEEDAALMWIPEITKSVTFFHMALDDDLMGLKLTPATVMEALMQAGPVIVPDTIKYDPTKPTGYPNGRALTDQVVDITLAAVLLKLGPNQPLNLFASLPLNPPKNDVAFAGAFPYLAPPH